MAYQPQLFDDSGKARRDHPETSHAAADRIRDKAGTLRAKVYRTLFRSDDGLTDEQIALLLNMNPSTARPRRIELVERGLVEDSGETRLTRSGRKAIVWIITKEKT